MRSRIVHGVVHLGEAIVASLTWYLRVGAVIAVVFAFVVGRVVPSARGGSISFRLLLLPGAALLWPLVLVRTVRALRSAAPPAGSPS